MKQKYVLTAVAVVAVGAVALGTVPMDEFCETGGDQNEYY